MYRSRAYLDRSGDEIVVTFTKDLIMFHTNALSCQFPSDRLMITMDDGIHHGILRISDTTTFKTAMSLFIHIDSAVPLITFIQDMMEDYVNSHYIPQNNLKPQNDSELLSGEDDE